MRIILLAAALSLYAQNTAADLRATFEKLYARMDAAIAASDRAEIERLVAPEAQSVSGPIKIALRAVLASEMTVPGISRRAQIKEARLEDGRVVVLVDVHYAAPGKPGGASSRSESWARRGDSWVCVESVGLGDAPESSKPSSTSAGEAEPVIAELKMRARRLDDLEAFGAAVGDARIVGIGEATHGTREFDDLRQKLVEYLVLRKGFTVVAVEQNWLDLQPVNDYIHSTNPPIGGHAPLLQWMRAQNLGGARLTVTGFDMQGVGPAAGLALAYLRRQEPAVAPRAEAAYADARRIDEDHTHVFLPQAAAAAQAAREVLTAFDAHRKPTREWRDARHAAEAVLHACAMRVESAGFGYRDRMMARNIEWLADEAYPGEKIIVSAHTRHMQADENGYPTMGACLRKRFAAQYYAVGTTFRRGEVWATGVEKGVNRGPGAWPVPASPEGTGDAILSAAGLPQFFLDLHALPDGPLRKWLGAPHRFHSVGSLISIGDDNLADLDLGNRFDGLAFFEVSHAARR